MNYKSPGLYKGKGNLMDAQVEVHGEANAKRDRWQNRGRGLGGPCK